jgi:hypothetical protein
MNLNINGYKIYMNIKRKLGFNITPKPSGGDALYSLISCEQEQVKSRVNKL